MTEYIWQRSGSYAVGTIKDYAAMWERDQYAGEHDLTTEVLTWQTVEPPLIHDVTIERGFTNADGWTEYVIRVPSTGDAVKVRLPKNVT